MRLKLKSSKALTSDKLTLIGSIEALGPATQIADVAQQVDLLYSSTARTFLKDFSQIFSRYLTEHHISLKARMKIGTRNVCLGLVTDLDCVDSLTKSDCLFVHLFMGPDTPFHPIFGAGATSEHLSIIRGSEPLLIVSIHCNFATSPTNRRRRKEADSERVNKDLHAQLAYWSFIYTGYRSTCMRDTKEPLAQTIEEMLGIYGTIGVISLHGRGRKYTEQQYPDSIFELGTLHGKTLCTTIADDFDAAMKQVGIVYDHDYKFTGGGEVKFLHRRFNDPDYVKGKAGAGHNSARNRVQIAQMEFNDWETDWHTDGVDQRIKVCTEMGKLMIAACAMMQQEHTRLENIKLPCSPVLNSQSPLNA